MTVLGIGNYILDERGEPVLCPDWDEWGAWYQTSDRTIRRTEVCGLLVSTVFLGMDHNFVDDGPPHLFETMIFPIVDGELSWSEVYGERYSTRAEAIAGHTRAVDWVLAGS